MTEQEAKDLRIGDVVAYENESDRFIVIGVKSGARALAVKAGFPIMPEDYDINLEAITPPRKWRIVSQVVSRQGKPVDKL